MKTEALLRYPNLKYNRQWNTYLRQRGWKYNMRSMEMTKNVSKMDRINIEDIHTSMKARHRPICTRKQ